MQKGKKITYDLLLAKVNHPYTIWGFLYVHIMTSSDTWPQYSNLKKLKEAKSSFIYTFGNCKG